MIMTLTPILIVTAPERRKAEERVAVTRDERAALSLDALDLGAVSDPARMRDTFITYSTLLEQDAANDYGDITVPQSGKKGKVRG
jgi:hypothetical protein